MSHSKFIEYSGMSYEDESREAERLICSIGWFRAYERLDALRAIMLYAVNRPTFHKQ